MKKQKTKRLILKRKEVEDKNIAKDDRTILNKAEAVLSLKIMYIAKKHVHKGIHEIMHGKFSCTKRFRKGENAGKNLRDLVPIEIEDEALKNINNKNFLYLKRLEGSDRLLCLVYDINMQSSYFKLTVELKLNNEKTQSIVKTSDYEETFKDVDKEEYFLFNFKKKEKK